ncbi:MAG: arginine--tRNA ligase [Thermodesulfovibrionales bacterium]|nr:arginine--tRNA ligase [Thermodesulfovibrionales bacterium]
MIPQIKQIIHNALSSLVEIPVDDIEIEIPTEESFGDIATPIAMKLAKVLKKAPHKIAEDILNKINEKDIFSKVEIAGPGYINFSFSEKFLSNELIKLLKNKKDYFFEDIGKGQKILIEFVSANPTGPLHLGHGRGAALGEALFNLLKFNGYSVEKEYYINDAGRQVNLLGSSVLARYKQLKGLNVKMPQDGYHGNYIVDIAKEFLESGLTEEEMTDHAYKKILSDIKNVLSDFGIFFHHWQSEKALYLQNYVSSAIEELKKKQLIYLKDGAYWFKSTFFGDDKDRVVIKSDGEYTYFASDIAYHKKKIERGYNELINIWGADHHGYIPRIEAVIEAFGYPKDKLRILLVQMVSLLRNGVPVSMSKRTGEFITLKEIADEIGVDTTKFLFLTRRHDSHIEIDIELAKKQSHDNPVYYVQYAHARIKSIFKKFFETAAQKESNIFLTSLNSFNYNLEELRLIKKALLYKMTLANATKSCEPHRITFYLQELASLFHNYYQKFRVLTEDELLTKGRLALCEAIGIVLNHGLEILNVRAPDKM